MTQEPDIKCWSAKRKEELIKQIYRAQATIMLREGSIVDATIISAPSSTKNRSGKRAPDMHQTKKGNEWHFGMKMHIGVDDTLGLIHSIETTAANVHDIVPSGNLLHGEERRVFGDAGYLGIQKRSEHKHRKNVSWFIARRPSARKGLDEDNRLHLLAAFSNLLIGEKYLLV